MAKVNESAFETLLNALGGASKSDLDKIDEEILNVGRRLQSLLQVRKLMATQIGDDSPPPLRADGAANGQKRGGKKKSTPPAAPPPAIPAGGIAERMVESIAKDGPASYSDLAERLKSDYQAVYKAVNTHPGWFTKDGGKVGLSQTGLTEHRKHQGTA